MTDDTLLRSHLARAADGLRFDADASLERLHRGATRRRAVRRGATIVIALVVALVGLGGAWLFLPAGEDRAPVVGEAGPSGTIAYTRVVGDGAGAELAAVDAASSAVTSLPGGPYTLAPVWSPDGTMVAYAAGEDYDHLELFVADADGTNARSLGVEVGGVAVIAWSPDGTRLAYVRGDELPNGFDVVAVVGADGTGDVVIARGVQWQSVDWSPDGGRLVLTGHPPNDEGIGGAEGWDVYTVDADGSSLTQLTDTLDWEHSATWSPDGTRIVFGRSLDSSDDADYRQDVWIMNADGSGARPVTDRRGFDGFPTWSPDGEWIAFSSDRDATEQQQRAFRGGEAFGGISIFAIRPDGTDVRPVIMAGHGEALIPGSWKA